MWVPGRDGDLVSPVWPCWCQPRCPLAGARADVNPDEVAGVLWKYFTELGSNAKDTVEQLQQSELTKQLK